MLRIVSLFLFCSTALCLHAQEQTGYFFSMGINVINPKVGFLSRPDITQRGQAVFKKKPNSLVGFSMELGISRNTRHFRFDVSYKLNTLNYKFSPAISPDTETATTKISYLANHLVLLPNYLIPRTNFSVGLGAEMQYLTKPKIETTGSELHNIIDNYPFSVGGLFQISYSMKLGKSRLMAGYQFAFYMVEKNPFSVTLMYNMDYANSLFTHQPDFNTHILKIAYVFAK